MVERKLYRTRLCVLYQRGRCSRKNCSFVHGDTEIRRFSASYGGKRNYRDGDLRDKLDRRLSPAGRYSPGRDVRDRRVLRGYSPVRSVDKKRNRKKKEDLDGKSDFSENLKISNEIKDLDIEGTNISYTSKSILEDQLNEVRMDINKLIQQKHELEIFVEEKIQEADTLTSRIQELDSQLEKEKEECKRNVSKIKKFVRAHNRCSQIGDELNRSQARLQKLGEQLGLNISGTGGDEENSNINIVSDVETNGFHMSYPQSEIRGNSSPSKKRACENQDITDRSLPDGKGRAETIRLGKRSRWSERPTQSKVDKENGPFNSGNSDVVPLASNEKPRKGNKISVSPSISDKLKGAHASLSLPSTNMAAHAVDDDDNELLEIEEEENAEVSGLPFLLPLPPPNLQNGYSQYEGEDQNVNINGLEEEMVDMDFL